MSMMISKEERKMEKKANCPICKQNHKIMKVQYYAYAGTHPIYEMFVKREGLPGDMKIVSSKPTGRTFKSNKDAHQAMIERNCS